MKKTRYKKTRIGIDAKYNEKEDYYELVIKDFEYPVTGVKRYYHSIFKFIELTGCDRIYLDWLTEVMGNDNSVYINEDEIARFISVMEKLGQSYKASTIKQSIKRLRASDLLLKTKKASGLFHVNPIFFGKCTEKERLENIKMTIEFKVGDSKESNVTRIRIIKEMQKMIKK